jgi:Transposase DDE domain group 1
MGEGRKEALRINFDRSVKVEFHGANVTSDAGLLVFRELDEALGLTDMVGDVLVETRTGLNTRHTLLAQLRQSVYSRLAGYEDTNDAEQLCQDRTIRQVVGKRAKEHKAASTSQMGRFETEVLTGIQNLRVLMDLSGMWIDRVHQRKPPKKLILDLDSSVSPTHGHQEGTAYNGHFECTCYHPIFCFNQYGDLERALLREGNVHTAEDWRAVLEPIIERYRELLIGKYFRGDAGYALPGLYEFLESEAFLYTIRLKSNSLLKQHIEHLLTRPEIEADGKPDVRYHDFEYQAGSWSKPRRVVAKVTWFADQLFPAVGFIVTNLNWAPRRVTHFYNQRGTAEQWIKEGKYALNWTRLSCHGFAANQVRLQLFALAYNLGNFLRRLALPRSISHWSLRTLQTKLIKIGAKVVKHARYTCFQMAEVSISRNLFAAILRRIRRLIHPVPV